MKVPLTYGMTHPGAAAGAQKRMQEGYERSDGLFVSSVRIPVERYGDGTTCFDGFSAHFIDDGCVLVESEMPGLHGLEFLGEAPTFR